MQFSADFIALGTHRADVRAAEHELGLRMSARERGADDADASSAVASERRRSHRRAPRLAFLR
ncbi:hypothetical protein [Agromyces sp. NPDC049794]|uniref:hypothetical protein n=1 Tax=unclassified Agromyces TaxID=2639701 RepID=UPI0033CBB16D